MEECRLSGGMTLAGVVDFIKHNLMHNANGRRREHSGGSGNGSDSGRGYGSGSVGGQGMIEGVKVWKEGTPDGKGRIDDKMTKNINKRKSDTRESEMAKGNEPGLKEKEARCEPLLQPSSQERQEYHGAKRRRREDVKRSVMVVVGAGISTSCGYVHFSCGFLCGPTLAASILCASRLSLALP